MPAVATRNQGKSMFVKEELNNNPTASAEAINAAWRAAGMSGGISSSLISNMRTRMKLAGHRRRKRRQAGTAGAVDAGAAVAGKRRGRPPKQAAPGGNGQTPATSRGRERELMSLEVEIDRVLMRVVQIGALPEVENALRKVRRQLYAGLIERS
jgi:hypothetical protein